MKKIIILQLIVFLLLTVGCSSSEPKYEISNDSNLNISDMEYENLYERARNAAFAYIDIIEEDEYLSAEESKLKVFSDKSAAFLLRTVDKPDVEDDTVMVTFSYSENEKDWGRQDIIYNMNQYGNK